MIKRKTTPAPWHIERKERSGFIESIGPCVADGYAGIVWLEVSEEDARLISSAPELLEALQLLLREMEESGNAGSKDYGWPLAISKSREALEKVFGEGRCIPNNLTE